MALSAAVVQYVKDFLRSRKRSYVETFDNPVGHRVLKDLAKFCRAHTTTMHPDPRMHGNLEGRREVWLRIQSHMQLDDERLWQLYGKDSD